MVLILWVILFPKVFIVFSKFSHLKLTVWVLDFLRRVRSEEQMEDDGKIWRVPHQTVILVVENLLIQQIREQHPLRGQQHLQDKIQVDPLFKDHPWDIRNAAF